MRRFTNLMRTALSAVALLNFWALSAQAPLVPAFSEVVSPVDGTAGMAAAYESSASWGDYNNDDKLDLIVAGVGQPTVLYQNNGDGTFSEVEHAISKVQQGAVAWGDYDNDGYLDLFISGRTDEGTCISKLYRNEGEEAGYGFQEVTSVSLQPVYTGGSNQTTRYLSLADYNTDGYVDVLLTGQCEVEGTTVRFFNLYKNISGESFELQTDLVGGTNFLQLNGGMSAWGDLNNDGYPDILFNGYTNEAPNCRSGIYVNNGDGTFTASEVELNGTLSGELAWSDYNNDGYLDFVLTGYSYDVSAAYASLYKNNGDGTFELLPETSTHLEAAYEASLAWGDLNNDGLSDLIMNGNINGAARSILFLNNGDDTFTKDEAQLPAARAGNVSLADYDSDSDLDVFLMGYGSGPVAALMENNLAEGISANEKPSEPTALTSTVEEGVVRLEWTRSTDVLTPDAAIQYNVYIQKEGSEMQMTLLPANTATGFLKVSENLAGLTTNFYEIKGLEDGEYTFGVQAIDNGKSSSAFATGTFTVGEVVPPPLGTNDIAGLNIYARDGGLVIANETGGTGHINIYDLRGVKVWSRMENTDGTTYVNGLHSGLYIVTITTDREFVSRKVVLP